MSERPDIDLVCDHGITGSTPQLVQRYEWKADQAVWLPRDRSVTTVSYVDGGNWLIDPESAVPREHHDTRCKSWPRCRRKVSVRADTLMWAFRLMVSRGESESSLTGLQKILENMPKGLKPQR